MSVTEQLTRFGEVRRGFVGVQISLLTPDMAEAFGLKDVRGVVVDEVVADFPADKAGIKRGDVIVKLGGRAIRTPNDLRTRVAQQAPGTQLQVTLWRNKELIELEVEVGDRNQGAGGIAGAFLEGISVQPLTGETRSQLGLRASVEGLLVTAAEPGSPYARSLPKGLVILEINDQPATSVASAREALRDGINKLYVYSDGRTGYLALRLP